MATAFQITAFQANTYQMEIPVIPVVVTEKKWIVEAPTVAESWELESSRFHARYVSWR